MYILLGFFFFVTFWAAHSGRTTKLHSHSPAVVTKLILRWITLFLLSMLISHSFLSLLHIYKLIVFYVYCLFKLGLKEQSASLKKLLYVIARRKPLVRTVVSFERCLLLFKQHLHVSLSGTQWVHLMPTCFHCWLATGFLSQRTSL